ncbi:MAG TPA: hypothetical protein VMT91_15840 [Anaerolineales bacterium]|nr:hypothetical protein [Anaerolineales bacterium]
MNRQYGSAKMCQAARRFQDIFVAKELRTDRDGSSGRLERRQHA